MRQISFKLQVFEGPLDLLLHLIQKNKVSISDIPIAEITEQYLDYLAEMEQFDMEVSSEFLVIAANLLYIKSKTLLPKYGGEEEEDPREELIKRLIEYKRIKQAAEVLEEKQFLAENYYFKNPEYIEPILVDESFRDVTQEKLQLAYIEVFRKLERRAPAKKESFIGIVGHEIVSVMSKVKDVLGRLKRFTRIRFRDIFRTVTSRSEAVASFLAVLELMKLNRVTLSDTDGEVMVTYEGDGEEPEDEWEV